MLNLQEFMKTDPSTGPTHKPVTIPEIGLRQSVLEDLALKHLYLSGPFSVLEMAKMMRISFEVASELLKEATRGAAVPGNRLERANPEPGDHIPGTDARARVAVAEPVLRTGARNSYELR